jgi:hypothetical protein
MIRNFPTDDLIDRHRSKFTIAPMPHVGLQPRPLQASISRPLRPLHPRLIGLGAAFLIAALATDLAYANSLLFRWENFLIWLLTGGLLLAAARRSPKGTQSQVRR